MNVQSRIKRIEEIIGSRHEEALQYDCFSYFQEEAYVYNSKTGARCYDGEVIAAWHIAHPGPVEFVLPDKMIDYPLCSGGYNADKN